MFTIFAATARPSIAHPCKPRSRTLYSVSSGLRSIFSDILFGFRFLCREKTLLFMLLLFALINFLLASTSVLFPTMAKYVLHVGARGFGLFG